MNQVTIVCENDFALTEDQVDLIQQAVSVCLAGEKNFNTWLKTQNLTCRVDLSLVASERIAVINKESRQVDQVTDVLSFPSLEIREGQPALEILPDYCLEDPSADEKLFLLGDIVICPDRAREQAATYGHSLERELAFLAIHGCLHLLGYDHMEAGEEKRMRGRQAEVLVSLGLSLDFRAGFVSILGQPNVGKSTLLNRLMQEKLAITSYKPQTTRHLIRGVLDREKSQIVFVDSPGVMQPKHQLDRQIQKASSIAMMEADLALLVIQADFKPYVGKVERQILRRLQRLEKPVILVINKVDLVAKERLLDLIACFNAYYPFIATVPVSAIRADGLDLLVEEIEDHLPCQPKLFNKGEFTDQTEKVLAKELIRLEALKQLDEEVPHGVAVAIESFEETYQQIADQEVRTRVKIQAVIYCDKKSHKGILIGKQGRQIKQIGQKARESIGAMLQCPCDLMLLVKLSDNWRNQLKKINELELNPELVEPHFL